MNIEHNTIKRLVMCRIGLCPMLIEQLTVFDTINWKTKTEKNFFYCWLHFGRHETVFVSRMMIHFNKYVVDHQQCRGPDKKKVWTECFGCLIRLLLKIKNNDNDNDDRNHKFGWKFYFSIWATTFKQCLTFIIIITIFVCHSNLLMMIGYIQIFCHFNNISKRIRSHSAHVQETFEGKKIIYKTRKRSGSIQKGK